MFVANHQDMKSCRIDLLAALLACLLACTSGSGDAGLDAGQVRDGAAPDVGGNDAGTLDSGVPDAGVGDAGVGDAGVEQDGSSPDAGGPRPLSVDCESFVGAGSFYEDNPTLRDPVDDAALFEQSTPAAEGLDQAQLEAAADALMRDDTVWSFLVMRHGKLVFERYFHGADAQASNNVHSASKSILSAAVGVALARGEIESLDQPVAELLPDYFAAVDDSSKRQITIRHLLTMTAGFEWTEDETEYELESSSDWVASIVALPLSSAPGGSFEYSTGLTHLLSAALTRASGMSTCEYAHRFVLEPLGIVAERWGRDPAGFFSGGYNLYLTARELARFGQMVLDLGRLGSTEIVPESYMAQARSEQVDAGRPYGYGFGFWTRVVDGHDVAIAWGYGGQYAYIVPSLDLMVTMTTNTRDYSRELDGEAILRDYILPFAN